MKTIVHLSDIHFGAENPAAVDQVLKDISRYQPDLVIVSGDLTQRARSAQYLAAARFLSGITSPKLVVPGNHDISLWNLFRRFFRQLKKYQTHISRETFPVYEDSEMIVAGINSARSLTIKGGRISVKQIIRLKTIFCETSESRFKAVAIHHNLIPLPDGKKKGLPGRTRLFLSELKNCGIDMVFSGHLHRGYTADIRKYHKDTAPIIIAQAGTAASKRIRNEQNSYNRVAIHPDKITIQVMRFNGRQFIPDKQEIFNRRSNG